MIIFGFMPSLRLNEKIKDVNAKTRQFTNTESDADFTFPFAT